MKWLTPFIVIAGLSVASLCQADTVYLQDGRQVQGKINSVEGAPTLEIDTALGVQHYPASMVERVVRGDASAAPAALATTGATGAAGHPEVAGTTGTPAVPDSADAAGREKYAQAAANADKATLGAEGLAIWTVFLKDVPTGSLAEAAKSQLAIWQKRADEGQVRFGLHNWLAKDKADKANALIAQADNTKDVGDAAKLFTQAAVENPYRVDIPFKKAILFFKADAKSRNFGKALGEVVAVDSNNVPARNDMGVLMALDQQWTTALANLAKAAAFADNDLVFDNFDQVMAMAEEANVPYAVLAGYDQQFHGFIDKLHKAQKHKGEDRWGNSWVKQDLYDKYTKANVEIDAQVAADNKQLDSDQRQLAACDADIRRNSDAIRQYNNAMYGGYLYGSVVSGNVPSTTYMRQCQAAASAASQRMPGLWAEIRSIKIELATLPGKKTIPSHANKLVLLNADGSVLDTKDATLKSVSDPKPDPKGVTKFIIVPSP